MNIHEPHTHIYIYIGLLLWIALYDIGMSHLTARRKAKSEAVQVFDLRKRSAARNRVADPVPQNMEFAM